ncbi:MAG TPA: hypothetical protein ENJ27_00890 [Candidatus Moranbacteria bacterium]|nr:hypothetical protein [Candidatus Moranbacteria bacterium]
MMLKKIKDEELIFGKEYSLLEWATMMVSVDNEGLLTDYNGLQIKFEVRVRVPLHIGVSTDKSVSKNFVVMEGSQFQPITNENMYKIIARKPGDDNNIKPNWKYYLLQYEAE